MTSFAALVQHWAASGAPSPSITPSRTSAIRRARRILKSTSGPILVADEKAKETVYGLADLVGSQSLRESSRAVNALFRVRWKHDVHKELTRLRRRATRALVDAEARRRSFDETALRDLETYQPDETLWSQRERVALLVERLLACTEISPATAYRISDDLLRLASRTGCDPQIVADLALVAGTAGRMIHRLNEADSRLREARKLYRRAGNDEYDIARVQYQRLAVLIERRELHRVTRASRPLGRRFLRLGMTEWALKCLLIEGACLRELGEPGKAIRYLETVHARAKRIGSAKMEAMSLTTMAHCFADLGEAGLSVGCARKAHRALEQFQSPITSAKTHLSLAMLLANLGHLSESVEILRAVIGDLLSLRFQADAAAIRLVVADILVRQGNHGGAILEISAAVPDLEEFEMSDESHAAVALLENALIKVKGAEPTVQRLRRLRAARR